MSYNICSGGFEGYDSRAKTPERIEQLTRAVREVGADWVGLIDTYRWKEIYNDDDLRRMFGYQKVMTVNIGDRRFNLPIGITVMTNQVAKLTVVKMYNRRIIKTEVLGKEKIDIFAVYLDDQNEGTRLKQIKALIDEVDKKKPTVLIGDFNSMDKNDLDKVKDKAIDWVLKFPQLKKLERVVREMKKGKVVELLKSKGFQDFGTGSGNTIPAKLFPLPVPLPIYRIDMAFGNSLVEAGKFEVLRNQVFEKLSDHYPIAVEI